MVSSIRSITVDCADPARLAGFWAEVLGYRFEEPPIGYDTWEELFVAEGIPEDEWNDGAGIYPPVGDGSRLLFLRVPEGKVVKNRWHLDLQPESTMGEEVERLTGLGATVVRLVEEDDSRFTVMQDPEGNEFCVERSARERQSQLRAPGNRCPPSPGT